MNKRAWTASLLACAIGLASAAPGPVGKGFTPKDPAIANPESIVKWLEKRGELTNATEAEKQAALQRWLATAVNNSQWPEQVRQLERRAEKLGRQATKIRSLRMRKSGAAAKTVKVLNVLIEFPDVPHDNNGLSPSDTDMYYTSYSRQHYEDMLFKQNGYAGPSGQTLITARDYYDRESGGTLVFTGGTFGWVTADNNAKFYGENDPNNNDQDKNVEPLIIEAVNKAVTQFNIDLTQYDVEDPYDRDGDGNLDEPDGFIDHVMVYHSTMGEEAGGGPQGADAIWSHRFFVNPTGSFATMGTAIGNTGKKVFGYTIQPIDAAVGVSVHEFGHDLGVADEYDTGTTASAGSPVGRWSLMAAGSWNGSPRGAEPGGFSPLARDYYQTRYGGLWTSKQVIDLATLGTGGAFVDLVRWEDTSGTGTNLVQVDVGNLEQAFFAPFGGSWQYYSGQGDNLNQSWSTSVTLPTGASSITLSMQAHWEIEQDWDYVQVLVNNTPVAGNHTSTDNPRVSGVQNYLSGNSSSLASGSPAWVALTYDLTPYAGQTITLSIRYVTDANTGGYGFAADNLSIDADGQVVWSDDAETDGTATMSGFARIGSTAPGKPARYYVQLRNHTDNDAGLSKHGYNQGVVVWFSDDNYGDNKVGDHPGHGFLGVVDADQTPLGSSSSVEIRDAAFGLNGNASDEFFDGNDYSHPEQPESGLILPTKGLRIKVASQAQDSSTARILVSKTPIALAADFAWTINFRTVSFEDRTLGGDGSKVYLWDFGDGNTSTLTAPSHTYAASGTYTVTLTVTDSTGATSTQSQDIVIADALAASFAVSVSGASVTVTDASTGGATLSYSWDFGDGSSAVTGSPATHTYGSSGTYTIVLTVNSSDGQTATASQAVTVSVPPNARYTFSVSGLTATFTNQTTGGDGAMTYTWDFGDGSSSTEVSPSHTFPQTGVYTVTLTATDAQGQSDTYSSTVSVSAPTPPASGGGGGGGSLWSFLLLLPLVRRRKE
jgi:immune inhibitor A